MQRPTRTDIKGQYSKKRTEATNPRQQQWGSSRGAQQSHTNTTLVALGGTQGGKDPPSASKQYGTQQNWCCFIKASLYSALGAEKENFQTYLQGNKKKNMKAIIFTQSFYQLRLGSQISPPASSAYFLYIYFWIQIQHFELNMFFEYF